MLIRRIMKFSNCNAWFRTFRIYVKDTYKCDTCIHTRFYRNETNKNATVAIRVSPVCRNLEKLKSNFHTGMSNCNIIKETLFKLLPVFLKDLLKKTWLFWNVILNIRDKVRRLLAHWCLSMFFKRFAWKLLVYIY